MEGEQLKQLRKDRGLSRSELGREFGVSEHTVAKWEQGVNPVPLSVERLLLSSVKLPISLEDLSELQAVAESSGISLEAAVAEVLRAGLRQIQAGTSTLPPTSKKRGKTKE